MPVEGGGGEDTGCPLLDSRFVNNVAAVFTVLGRGRWKLIGTSRGLRNNGLGVGDDGKLTEREVTI